MAQEMEMAALVEMMRARVVTKEGAEGMLGAEVAPTGPEPPWPHERGGGGRTLARVRSL